MQNYRLTLTKLFVFICVGIFVFSFIFFSQIHPVTLFDGDDWTYISLFRKPFPIWGNWNPIRVLPETFLPLVGFVSAYFTNFFVHDYIYSITLTIAIFLAFLLVCIYILFVKYLSSFNCIERHISYFLGLLFIIANFGFFKSRVFDNTYMLSANNLICYFYYVVPSLLNCLLVFFMSSYLDIDDMFKNLGNLQKSFFLSLIYFAIFSNVFNSAIMALFCFSNILYTSFIRYKIKIYKHFNDIIKNNKVYSSIVFVWIISLVFEMRGGRAAFLGKSSRSYFDLPIKETILNFLSLMKLINHYWLAMIIIVACVAVLIFLRDKNSSFTDNRLCKDTIIFAISNVLIGIFLILVCSKAAPKYAGNIQCVYGFYFYILMIFFTSSIYLLSKSPRLNLLLPLIVVCMFILATNSSQPLIETNIGNHLPSECKAIDEDLIRQIQEADRQKKKEMVLRVPKGDDNDNWPHPKYMGKNISRALFAHGLISKNITIKIQPDISMNEKYYIK